MKHTDHGRMPQPLTMAPMAQSRRCQIALAAALLLLAAAPKGRALEPFAVELSVETTYRPSASHTKSPDQVIRFRLESDQARHRWRIDDRTHSPKGAWTTDDYIVQNTGTTPRGKQSLIASAYHDGYPIDLDWDERLLWFVYCATSYIKENEGKPVVIPHLDARLDLNVHGCRLKSRWGSPHALVPEHADFLFDQSVFKNSVELLEFKTPGDVLDIRERLYRNTSAAYTNGNVRAVIEVSSWKQVANMDIPEHWKLLQWERGDLAYLTVGNVDSASTLTEVATPLVQDGAWVTDKRVRTLGAKVNFVGYTTTNGNIPSATSPHVRKLISRIAQDQYYVLPPNLRAKRVLFGIALSVLMLLPLVTYFLRARHPAKSVAGTPRGEHPKNNITPQ